MLKAYMVYCRDPEDAAMLIFAKTAKQARNYGFKHWYWTDPDVFAGMRARRAPGADRLAKEVDEPYKDRRDASRRAAGFFEDSQVPCKECELHEFEDMPESVICRWCHCCAGCGCAEDCEKRAGVA